MNRSRSWLATVAITATVASLTGVAISTGTFELGPVNLLALPEPSPDPSQDCARRYVAGGDGVVKGIHADNNGGDDQDLAYPAQLLNNHLLPSNFPWCLYNTSQDPTTSTSYVDDGTPPQQALAWDLDPRLITLTVGRQNDTIYDHVQKCLDNIRDHDFIEANACALAVLAQQQLFDDLRDELAGILNTYKVQQAGNPNLIVAVVGYFNPYPKATDVVTKIPQFCAELQDVIPTCIARWVLLPPALVTLDEVVKKLNATIEPVVQQFLISSQGRFVFVNPYEQFLGHCMQIDVRIDITVYHPTNTVHDHNSEEDFGCDDDSWIGKDGKTSMKSPFLYLSPASTGVLLTARQKTENMGFNPNEEGHKCIAGLIWQKVIHLLDVPDEAEEPCQ